MQSHSRWTRSDIPDQHGRIAVVTGANSGIGFEAAAALAGAGATVVLACRDAERAAAAAAGITDRTPDARPEVVQLDLSSLESVRQAARTLHERYDHIDLLLNNAGVMWLPRGETVDGFERQLGINHLGHFALTGLLLDMMRDVAGSRVVTVSSLAHRSGRINFADLQLRRGYGRHKAYSQSKLANLMFTYTLQRRLTAAGARTIALAAHPGLSRTELLRSAPGPIRTLVQAAERLVLQDAAAGALPSLRAATDPYAIGGQFYGPDRSVFGHPVVTASNAASQDVAVQTRLWTESEELTNVEYDY